MPGLRDKLNQPTVDNPEGGVGTFIWEKIVKRTPGYAYEVFDALSPLKTRDIDWKKDAAFGVLPLQVPPLAKGVWQLGTEAVTGYAASATGGDKANKQRRRRRLDISLQLFKDEKAQKLSPEENASLQTELDDLFNQDFMGFDKEDLRPRDLLSIAGRQYPTWQALYSDLRDTIPGAPELEAIVLMEPDKIPEATQRWMDKWKNEPLDLISLALGVTKSRLLMKAGKLRKTATAKKSTDAGKLIAQAEQYENAAKWVGRANPEEAPAGIMAAGIKSLSPPGMQAYNPEVEGTYGVDPDTGRPLTTTMRPEQFGEQLGIDKDVLPIAVLSDYDYGAMVEGWARFYDRRGALKINPTELREDTVSGAARRFLVAKQMIQDQRRTHAEGLADDLGVPRTHTTDPHAAGKAGIEVFQGWQARQDRQANDIAKTIADSTSDPHDAGNLAHTHYEDWQLGKKTEFEKEFGEIDEALDTPLRSLTEAPPETPTPDTATATRTTAEIISELDITPRKGTRERLIRGNWGGKYTGRYGVGNFDNFIFSHYADGTANPMYPERLQPRDRSDVSSQMQSQKIGRELDSELMLDDTSSMNDGAALVKKAEEVYTPEEIDALREQGHEITGKWVVLSGNGRMAGIDYAMKQPEFRNNVQTYQQELQAKAEDFGVTDDVGQNPHEVLYREVVDDLDQDALREFVREANDPSGKGFRSSEVAGTDAQLIDADLLTHFETGDHASLREGLKANPEFVNRFIEKQPENKRSEFYDAGAKTISDTGYDRIERALLTSVFEGEAGGILSRRFADVSDPGLVNLRKAVYAALPELAEIKYYFERGERNADLDITEDIASAIFKTQDMVDDEVTSAFIRQQGTLFTDPDYENMLRILHVVEAGRTDPKQLTNFLKWYADQIRKQRGTDQGQLLDLPQTTKAEIIEAGVGENLDEIPDIEELRTKWEQKEAEAPTEAAPTPEAPPGLLATTRARLEELTLKDPTDFELQKVKQIIDEMIEQIASSEGGFTLYKLDKMRTNFRKRLANAVQNGEMTPIGKGQVAQLFYGTLTEDFYNLIEAEIAIDPTAFPEGFTVEKIRAAKADYRTTVVNLENSPAAVFLRRTQSKPATLIDELLKEKGVFNKDQLQTLKTILGDDGWTALQPALLDRFIGEATNPQTGNIYRDRLEKMIDKLNGTDKEKANRLLGAENVDKLRQIAKRTDIENSGASKFLEKTENAPAALIDELLKTKGVFDPDEIVNLKLILGEDGFRELQPGLLGRIYEMAAKNEKKLPENIDATGLRGMLDTITRRDKNKLIDIFGEETAEFLEQSALFAERFGRAKPWHKGSPTAKLQALLGTGGFTILADEIGRMLMSGRYNLEGLGPAEYTGLAIISASWGLTASYQKYILSDRGRKWLLEGWQYRLPGTNITVNSGHLNAAAQWAQDNKFEIGFATRIPRAERRQAEKKEPAPPAQVPIKEPLNWRHGLKNRYQQEMQ